MKRSMVHRFALFALLAGAGFTHVAIAQPAEKPSDPPPAGERGGARPRDRREGLSEEQRREVTRRMINAALEQARRSERILKESLDMLDRGEPIEAVREHSLKARPRAQQGGGAGGPGGGFGGFGGVWFDDRPLRGGPGGPDGPGGLEDEPRFGGPRGPGGPDGPDGPEARERFEALTPEQREEALELLRERGPEIYRRIQQLRAERPDEFDAMMRQRMPTLMKWLKERRDDPELYEARTKLMGVDREIMRTSRKIREGSAAADGPDGAKLRELLGTAFDLRVQLGRLEIDRLNKRLTKMSSEMEHRGRDRDRVIGERFDELVTPRPDGETPPPPPPGDRVHPGAMSEL